MKQQAAEKIGMKMFLKTFPGDITQIDLIKAVKDCNENKEIHGLIVQLPLPSHIDEKVVLDSVSYEKDVDGLHPLNIGTL
jgi:methylenetetrahydrofolate dehydrogenase (NADP+)/methenyltetrahydrofolate cyclohydrolase